MKNLILLTTLLTLLMTGSTFAQTQDAEFYRVKNGTGNGIQLWYTGNPAHENLYKIHMGQGTEYKYGPVTGYSIKSNMYTPDTSRGWTWGGDGETPIAALNTQGNFQVAGKIGIGSINVNHKLTIESGSGGGLLIKNTHGNSHIPWKDGIIYLSSNEFVVRTGKNGINPDRMRIDEDGNVGIGTPTPGNKLEVNGTIRTKEIIVETVGWPDYVFYDDYNLPTLEEEEKHIEANGHLMGFESEKDMAGEIQLGDVTERQQAKIEEMMLHLIEIKKEVKQLKEENEQLKKQIVKN